LPLKPQNSSVQKAMSRFESYLNMAGSRTANDFQPLSQRERTDLYLQSLTNTWGFAKAAMSAGICHGKFLPGAARQRQAPV
jgi:hypothetical protein